MKAESLATRKQNLNRLARYLIEFDKPDPWYVRAYNWVFDIKPPKFGMYDFHSKTTCLDSPRRLECGTVACAVGHGPMAGIGFYKNESWESYSHRVFINIDNRDWAWCFSGVWADYDDSATSAGLRILYYLAYGTPDWYCGYHDYVQHQEDCLDNNFSTYLANLEQARLLV